MHRLRGLTLATLALLTAVPGHSLGADPQPDSLPCTHGPAPAGYHVEHHVVGLIVGGIGTAVFGVGAVMAIGGFTAKDDSDGVARSIGRGGLVIGGIGGLLMLLGFTRPTCTLERDGAVSFAPPRRSAVALDASGLRVSF